MAHQEVLLSGDNKVWLTNQEVEQLLDGPYKDPGTLCWFVWTQLLPAVLGGSGKMMLPRFTPFWRRHISFKDNEWFLSIYPQGSITTESYALRYLYYQLASGPGKYNLSHTSCGNEHCLNPLHQIAVGHSIRPRNPQKKFYSPVNTKITNLEFKLVNQDTVLELYYDTVPV